LGYAQLIDYYRLRFQLEFNCRDAKQYWGLEDFMSVNAKPVYNSANLAMFMVNVSQALMRPMRAQWPAFSVNDLKAWCRGRKYGHWFRLMSCANKPYVWTLPLYRVMILPRETSFSLGGEHAIDANSMRRLWWQERRWL
jgi:hypothetical protein